MICGAVAQVRWAARKGAPAGSWLARMLARKPKLVVAVALANKNARIAWALMAKGGVYRVPGEVGAWGVDPGRAVGDAGGARRVRANGR